MNRLVNQQSNPVPGGTGPGRELFIYYLKGRLTPDCEKDLDNFLGNWQEENDCFLFFSSPAEGQVKILLGYQPRLDYIDSYRMSYDEWLGEAFSRFECGRFCVMPPWQFDRQRADNCAGRLLIQLDPGLVFGTGTHPTTRHCLEALELAAACPDVRTVLDLGTGTGLLTLAAARLGCSKIAAVDLNLLAANTALGNVRLNGLQAQIVVVQARAQEAIEYPADLVIANIHYDVMWHLIDTPGFFAKKRFVLSGLLRSEAKAIADRLARPPTRILKQWTHDGIWHTFYGSIY
jgi:ribosomal protein L11 methyltransferase